MKTWDIPFILGMKRWQTLQDVMVLLGLPIDEHAIKSPDVYNKIVLCKLLFELTPFSFGLSEPD
jgi:hypothetical protein